MKITFLITLTTLISMSCFAEDYPEPPQLEGKNVTLQDQAGLGSGVTFSASGVLELGGFLSYSSANEYSQTSISPSVGYFLSDNFEVTGILSYNHVKSKAQSDTYWTLLAEPSFHLPFTNQLFGFFGLGLGVANSDNLGEGFAFQPRVGAKFLIGRSGILTPSISIAYNTLKAEEAAANSNKDLIAVDTLTQVNLGYAIMF